MNAGGTTVRLQDGRLPEESWVYAVLSAAGRVLHVGGTGLPVAVRVWAHLELDDPAVGRLRAEVDPALLRDAVVVAVVVPAGTDRRQVRDRARDVMPVGSTLPAHPAVAPVAPPPPEGAVPADVVDRCVAGLLDRARSALAG